MRLKKNKIILLLIFIIVDIVGIVIWLNYSKKNNEFISYTANPKNQKIKLYWKDDNNKVFGSIKNLKDWLTRKESALIFAMNGGMYSKDQSPKGLFIQEKNIIALLDTTSGSGNFYLKPNGVFYITEHNEANICTTMNFSYTDNINYATQSGPMLVINENINPAFNATSHNVNIRNGVGILPDGAVVFAMSKDKINFYDFAKYFKNLGCKNALYLDGFVSRTYLPEKNWIQEDGNFGVIIGVIK